MKEHDVNTRIEKSIQIFCQKKPLKKDLGMDGIMILKWICTMLG